MKREIALSMGLLITLCLFAQGGKTYSGRVTDANGKPLARVSVLLLNPKGNTVKFTRTDRQLGLCSTKYRNRKVCQE